jgi:hypothetical protein
MFPLVSQAGENPKGPVQKRAEALQPQDEWDTETERALNIVPPEAIGKAG